MTYLLLAFIASSICTFAAVRSGSRHGRFSNDHDISGPQKFHSRPVPRIGGLGIIMGILVAGSWLLWRSPASGTTGLWLVGCGLPAFVAGLVEDFTKRVAPRHRLLATAVSAGLAAWFLDAVITYTAIPGLDWVVTFPLGAALVTMFVVAGVANAVNIIDGFNGLTSMCVLFMLLGIAYVGLQVNDSLIVTWALIGAGAILGFFMWNFPAGLIFLGDGGAYFLGFYLAELAILLIQRNPAVSPLFALLICIYPVVETLFSIYRKKVLRGMSPGLPDGVHLHMLIYKRWMKYKVNAHGGREKNLRNSMTSPYLWAICLLSVLPSVVFWDSTPLMATFIVLFGVVYVLLYWRIVRFKSPRWLIFRK